jgi:NCS1 family nucleobase:cation symporter-1
MLGALIGPLYGILIADYYVVRQQKIVVDDLFTMEEDGEYHYVRGYNPAAVQTVVVTGVVAVLSVVVPKLSGVLPALPDYSFFVGAILSAALYVVLARRQGIGPSTSATESTPIGAGAA